jgi:hypothetical protein
MLTLKDRKARYKAIERVRRNRIANIRKLAELYASWAEFCRVIGYDLSFIRKVAGDQPSRNMGEVVARDIERVLKLEPNWLDNTH